MGLQACNYVCNIAIKNHYKIEEIEHTSFRKDRVNNSKKRRGQREFD